MLAACDNIKYYMRNEWFLGRVHWSIIFFSKWLAAAYDKIEDIMGDEELSLGIH